MFRTRYDLQFQVPIGIGGRREGERKRERKREMEGCIRMYGAQVLEIPLHILRQGQIRARLILGIIRLPLRPVCLK